MGGETTKTKAICLAIVPWSRTSHVVAWLTPTGRISTVVKGAVRPKSFFLGQYDLNYTCEITYYTRAHGDLHALRDCAPLNRRDALRENYRALALAGYFRRLAGDLAPAGPEAAGYFELLERALDAPHEKPLAALLRFDLAVLDLAGLKPEIIAENGVLALQGERKMPLSPEVADAIRRPEGTFERGTLLDAARVFSVFYAFHVGLSSDVRRSVLRLIS